MVAVGLGEFFGHFFNDFVASRYIRKHDGVFEPEARLKTNYISAFLMIPGLITVGQALEKHLSYSAIVMGWGMYVFGVMTASGKDPTVDCVVSSFLMTEPSCHHRLRTRLLSFSVRRGFWLSQLRENDWWICRGLFPAALGTQGWVRGLVWRSSRDRCCGAWHLGLLASVWRENESERRAAETLDLGNTRAMLEDAQAARTEIDLPSQMLRTCDAWYHKRQSGHRRADLRYGRLLEPTSALTP